MIFLHFVAPPDTKYGKFYHLPMIEDLKNSFDFKQIEFLLLVIQYPASSIQDRVFVLNGKNPDYKYR